MKGKEEETSNYFVKFCFIFKQCCASSERFWRRENVRKKSQEKPK